MTIKNTPEKDEQDLIKAEREKREKEQLEESSEAIFRALSRRDSDKKKKTSNDEDSIKITFLKKSSGRMSFNNETGAVSLNLRKIENEKDRNILRGQTDHFAFKRKHFDEDLFNQFDPSETVGHQSEAAQFFKIFEDIRTDAIGSKELSGVAKNMRTYFENSFLDKERRETFTEKSAAEKKRLAFKLILAEKLTNIPLSDNLEFYASPFREKIEKSLHSYTQDLQDTVDKPDEFYKTCLDYLQENFPELPWPEPEQSNEAENSDDNQQSNEPDDNGDQDAENEEHQDNQNRGQEEENDKKQDPAQIDIDQMGIQSSNEGNDNEQNIDLEQSDNLDLEEMQDYGGNGETPMGGRRRNPHNDDLLYEGYSIYTREFDQIIRAKELVDPLEIDRLKSALDFASKDFKSDIRNIGNRLKRYLMAQQNSRWQFDQEEGMLDPSRLARIVANPMTPLAFKIEELDDMMDTVVTILVDNSGSMRGKPIAIAATCTDMLARTLEQCDVKNEILGYTTRAWKGGLSRDQWVRNGKPDNPGRLNDTRHIIYKPADMPLRACRDDFSIMMKEGLLKENIDGEALIWAYKRLKARPEKRKILIVISDGAPVDDSTNNSNNGSYLEKHMNHVIGLIQKDPSINLSAIGIGHNVDRYYENSIHIPRADLLASTLANQILLLFADPNKPATKRMIRRAAKQMRSMK